MGGVVAGSSMQLAAWKDDADKGEMEGEEGGPEHSLPIAMGNRVGGKAGQGGRKKKGPRMGDAQEEGDEEDWEEFEKRGEDEELDVDGDEDDGVGFRDAQAQIEWEYYKRHGKMPPASTQSMPSKSSLSSSTRMRRTTIMRLRGGGEGDEEDLGGKGNEQGGRFMSGFRRIASWLSSGITQTTGKDDIMPPPATGSPLFNICPPSSGADGGGDVDDDATGRGDGGGGKINSIDVKGENEPKKRGSGGLRHLAEDGEGEGGGEDAGDSSGSGLKKRNVAVFFCYDGSGKFFRLTMGSLHVFLCVRTPFQGLGLRG